jgi:hypothetical protein
MALYDRNGKGHYPYSFWVEPYFNGAPIRYNNQCVISPRYTNSTTADNFSYSVDGDYAPSSAYADLSIEWPGMTAWYHRLSGHGGPTNLLGHPGSLGSRSAGAPGFYNNQDGSSIGTISIWMSILVGSSPHPGDAANQETYFSMLCNANGDYGGGSFYSHPGGTPAPSSPREYIEGSRKIRLASDNYGNGAYRGWVCIANQARPTGYSGNINATTMRIINIGRSADSAMRIIGFRIVYHVLPPENNTYGNQSL